MAQLYVVHDKGVDLFADRDGLELPLSRRPIRAATGSAQPIRIAIGAHPPGEGHTGGTALLLASRWPDGVATEWLSMSGQAIQGPALVEDLGELTQLVPRGEEWPGLVFTRPGGSTVVVGEHREGVPASGTLVPSNDSGLIWRSFTQDGPVLDRPIELSD
jgi:hypothetical protein